MALVFSTYIDRIDPDKKKKEMRFISNSASKFKPVYELQINDGIKELVQVGEHNLYEEIQSYASETDINNIIARYVNGEYDVLNQVRGVFGDFSNLPDNYAELFNRVQSCENLFNSLPVDLRAKFDNSYQKFWSEFGSESFDSILNEFGSSPDPVSDESKVDDIVIEKKE